MSDPRPAVTTPGDWRRRRRVIYATLAFCAVEVARIVERGGDSALSAQIAIALIGLAASAIGFYVAGATWDDHNARKAQS